MGADARPRLGEGDAEGQRARESDSFLAMRVLLPLFVMALVLALQPAALLAAETEASPPPKNVRRFVRVPAPDGISIRRLNKTDGKKPRKKDRVIVHYHGTLQDGTVFDSTRGRGPANFNLSEVVPCWTVALTRLREGEKAEIRCPAKTAYGAKGAPPRVPPNATLDFEIELIRVP